MLKPVFSCPDPIRGGDNKLVLCEVYLVDGTPHETNTRALLRPIAAQYEAQDSWYGIEQEYTFFKDGRPWLPERGFPPRRASTTAAWARTRCSGARSSSGTWTPAWRRA